MDGATRGLLARDSCPKHPHGPQVPPWAPQPHQQPEREVAAPKKWDLWAQYPTGARSQEKSSTRAFQKWQNPNSTGEQWEQRDPLGCATTLVGSRAQETADTRRKGLKRAKKEHFCTFHHPLTCQSSRGCLRARSFGGGSGNSRHAGILWPSWIPSPSPGISHLTPAG